MEKGIAAYNDALSRNNKLKNQIDELRKDKKNQSQAYRQLTQKVEEITSSINGMAGSIENKKVKVNDIKR